MSYDNFKNGTALMLIIMSDCIDDLVMTWVVVIETSSVFLFKTSAAIGSNFLAVFCVTGILLSAASFIL